MTIPALAPPAPDLKRYRGATTLTMRGADESTQLPAGVIGQVEGIALVYDVVDSHGTTFARGCLDQTIRQRVATGKVKLYVDHGDAPLTGMYDTHLHIGTVREMWDATEPNGQHVCRFRADIFDTEQGRKEYEYLKAVAATESETGVSIGMLDMPETARATIGGVACERITKVPLREISITGESSVPGTRVTHVRADVDYFILLDGMYDHVGHAVALDRLRARMGDAAVRAHLSATISDACAANSDAVRSAPPTSDSLGANTQDSPGASQGGTEPPLPNTVPMTERIAFLRSTYQRP